MILTGTNHKCMPFFVDTSKIDFMACYETQGYWYCRLALDGTLIDINTHWSITINGITFTNNGDIKTCSKIAELIGEIVYLERQDPPVDMDRFSKIGKE